MDKLRVIQWTTGKVGKLSLRGILDDPRLELVGVYAYSEEKAGTDAGPLCGRPDTGVLATTDIDALIALGADTVFYTPFMADVDHAVRLLESGLDVISTNLFLNVGGIAGETEKQLAAACERGDSSLYITGVNPGWINTMVTAMTAVCRDVQTGVGLRVGGLLGLRVGRDLAGAGLFAAGGDPGGARDGEDVAEHLPRFRRTHGGRAALRTRRHGVLHRARKRPRRTVDLGWLLMKKDTIAAIRAGWNGKVNGKTVVQSNVAWYLTKKLNGDWVFDDDHYHVVIKGEPEIQTRLRPRPHRLFSCVRLQYELADAGQTYGVNVAVTSVDARNVKFDIKVDDQPKP